MNLKRFIYEFNLVSTQTITETEELFHVLSRKETKEIDYSNSISLYHLVELFNKLYLFFEKDYQKLEKIDLGECIEFLNFYKSSDYRLLEFRIVNPNKEICDVEETLLYLIEDNEKIFSFVTNNLNFFAENYYRKDGELNEELVKKYLDLAEKHSLFLDAYKYFKNKFIFGNGTTVLFSKVNGVLLKKLDTFEVSFGNQYFNTSDYINIPFILGENFDIDYDSSEIIFHLEKQENKKEIIDELINKVCITCNKLSDVYKKEKQIIKEMKK